ncbi:MAG: AAA family ATPase [Gammaproteobacteria bacterium]|nr:MAG: AAA family ATPase [Gammaproteobacteria bacterium]
MKNYNLNIPANKIVKLPKTRSWPESIHLLDDRSINAIKAALAAERPLLIRGEPGTGKSQLARAAAQCLGRLFISEVVHARSESQDLQWHFDAVRRLGDAQVVSAGATQDNKSGNKPKTFKYSDEKNYLGPGPLWWAFDYAGAIEQFDRCERNLRQPPELPTFDGEIWTPDKGSVLLIDEIDKADADLPNGLLETLGNGAFTVPYLDQAVGHQQGMPAPLVVITTNEERALPAAFVRRCMVLHLCLPEGDALIPHLVNVGNVHFESTCSEGVRTLAAQQLVADRTEAKKLGLTAPGQAEYLDILRVLSNLAKTEQEQIDLLDEIKDFALKKHIAEA